MDFVTALVELQEACGVADLKMSDYGIQKEGVHDTGEERARPPWAGCSWQIRFR